MCSLLLERPWHVYCVCAQDQLSRLLFLMYKTIIFSSLSQTNVVESIFHNQRFFCFVLSPQLASSVRPMLLRNNLSLSLSFYAHKNMMVFFWPISSPRHPIPADKFVNDAYMLSDIHVFHVSCVRTFTWFEVSVNTRWASGNHGSNRVRFVFGQIDPNLEFTSNYQNKFRIDRYWHEQ